MSNWKTDFEVKFHLHFKHHNGKEEKIYNSIIIETDTEEKAKEIVSYQYDNSSFLVIDEVKKLWKY
tara:strand:- start:119 stop:316 length:198 start_codon:yes stop_codon:yes gene_type:complete